MYDQREKAQRDYAWAMKSARDEGIKIGIEQGIEQGSLTGKIQLLQHLLKQEPASMPSLLERSSEELALMLSDLQQQLRSRGL
jgi:flagellar biosynthesis/type III secretory pathway protein FliH